MKKIKNLKRLDDISNLQDNWNDNGAKPFSIQLIDACKEIIAKLYYQPEIFPTAANSIQFEYEKDNGDYIEFNVYEDKINVYQTNGQTEGRNMTLNIHAIEELSKLINDFMED